MLKHYSSLTLILLAARLLSVCVFNENKVTFNLKETTHRFLCFYVLSCSLYYNVVSCHSQPLLLWFLCLPIVLPSIALLFWMIWKQSICLFAAVAGSLFLPETVRCDESNFNIMLCNLLVPGTLKNCCCGETQITTFYPTPYHFFDP